MNICQHLIIETAISHSAFKPCFDSSYDTETPFCKSRNESYAAVNLKQFMYSIFKKHFLLVGFLLKTLQTVDIFVTFFRGVVLSLLTNLI